MGRARICLQVVPDARFGMINWINKLPPKMPTNNCGYPANLSGPPADVMGSAKFSGVPAIISRHLSGDEPASDSGWPPNHTRCQQEKYKR